MYNNIYSKLIHNLNMYISIRWNITNILIYVYSIHIVIDYQLYFIISIPYCISIMGI